jgi:hypothetical protein
LASPPQEAPAPDSPVPGPQEEEQEPGRDASSQPSPDIPEPETPDDIAPPEEKVPVTYSPSGDAPSLYRSHTIPPRRKVKHLWIALVVTICVLISFAAAVFKLGGADWLSDQGVSLPSLRLGGGMDNGHTQATGGNTHAGVVPLNTPVVIDGVKITVHSVALGPISKVDPFGRETQSEQNYLSLNVSLENVSQHPLYLLHTWENSSIRDKQDRILRPAFPSRFAIDTIVGTLGATELKPAQRLVDAIVFDAPNPGATEFVLTSNPGFWRSNEGANHVPASESTFEVSFRREDIRAPGPAAEETQP